MWYPHSNGIEYWDHGDEVVYWNNLGEEVSEVVPAWFPCCLELAICDAFFEPVVVHGDDFGSLVLDDVIVDEFAGELIVVNDLGGSLLVAKVFGCVAE